jgi:hypothetical protein
MKNVVTSAFLAITLTLPHLASSATKNEDGTITISKEEAADYLMSKVAAAESLRRLQMMAEAMALANAERDAAIRKLFMLNELNRKTNAMCS